MFLIILINCSLLTVVLAQSQEALYNCTEAIWAADSNSFTQEEFEYDTESSQLFTFVDETRFNTGVYPPFIDLLEKFNPQIGEDDDNLDVEIDLFLDTIMATEPMRIAHSNLIFWGRASEGLAEFKEELRQYWFLKFSRSGGDHMDSSGFEHVFQGEVREGGGEVTGFHGWVQAYRTETNGDFQYGSSDLDCGDDLIQLNNFYFNGALKDISSIWIGKSPELEFALYTVCFLARQGEDCYITVAGGRRMYIQNFTMSGVSPVTIGTVFAFC